jgi:hypothetical protein
MKKTVLVRGVDEEAYRRAKAAAALKGVPLGRAVSEALEEWSSGSDEAAVEFEAETDREFIRRSWQRLRRHKGRTVVISSGKLQGVFDTYDQASKFASKFHVAMTFTVEDRPSKQTIEIGPDLELQ